MLRCIKIAAPQGRGRSPSYGTGETTLDIHYQQAGSGPHLFVFVHGNFASWRWWKPIFDRLPADFRAVAPDLRGCGDTGTGGATASSFGVPRLAADLELLVQALDLPRFHLVGHSLGGAVALQFALQHGHRLRSLTLVSPAPAAGLAAMREGASRSAQMLRTVDPANAAAMARLESGYRMQRAFGLNRLALRAALAEMMPGASLEKAEFEALVNDAARMSPEALVGFLRALHEWNVEGELGRLRVPTLILAGGKDTLVPPAASEKTANLLPGARLVVWPQVGHSPQLERPDDFVQLLVAVTRRSAWGRLQTWLWLQRRRLFGPPLLTEGAAPSPAAGS